ncbi:MAG: hypothetical protein M1118_10685 [Chloroflexi bacterium]|nr:hypothetical protein [Chloroflexota bacterium]
MKRLGAAWHDIASVVLLVGLVGFLVAVVLQQRSIQSVTGRSREGAAVPSATAVLSMSETLQQAIPTHTQPVATATRVPATATTVPTATPKPSVTATVTVTPTVTRAPSVTATVTVTPTVTRAPRPSPTAVTRAAIAPTGRSQSPRPIPSPTRSAPLIAVEHPTAQGAGVRALELSATTLALGSTYVAVAITAPHALVTLTIHYPNQPPHAITQRANAQGIVSFRLTVPNGVGKGIATVTARAGAGPVTKTFVIS